jgi:hypothetical protein
MAQRQLHVAMMFFALSGSTAVVEYIGAHFFLVDDLHSFCFVIPLRTNNMKLIPFTSSMLSLIFSPAKAVAVAVAALWFPTAMSSAILFISRM